MKQKHIQLGLYSALMVVCIYGLTCLNQFEKSLDKHFEIYETGLVLPLCGEDYEENVQLAREMGHQEIANKIEDINGKTLDKTYKELRLEGLL